MRLFRLTLAGAFLMMGLPHGFVSAAPVLNEAAPPLVVTTLDGQTFDLSNLRGKVVLVNYWATWCAPCRKEMPTLDAFYRRYRSQGLELIGISVDFTRDGAKTWHTVRPDINLGAEGSRRDVTQMNFVDARHGWIVISDNTAFSPYGKCLIYRTSDGGKTWTEAPLRIVAGL